MNFKATFVYGRKWTAETSEGSSGPTFTFSAPKDGEKEAELYSVDLHSGISNPLAWLARQLKKPSEYGRKGEMSGNIPWGLNPTQTVVADLLKAFCKPGGTLLALHSGTLFSKTQIGSIQSCMLQLHSFFYLRSYSVSDEAAPCKK